MSETIDNELFENLNIPFDILGLKNNLTEIQNLYQPIMVGPFFGGWSITSSTSSYSDGWLTKNPNYNAVAKDLNELRLTNEAFNFKGPASYRIPTELHFGELKKIVDFLSSEGYFPCRCRLTILKCGGSTSMHRDYPEWLYGVRLHIPIVTNSGCFFEYENERRHFPANGSAILVKVNQIHRAVNFGNSDRVHFICDFFDTNKKTKFNKFTKQDYLKFFPKTDNL